VVTQAWLDVPPRRRVAIPAGDLAIGVGLGLALCMVGMVLAASLKPPPPPPLDVPLRVSIGVLATGDPGPSGGGEPKRAGKPGKRRARKDAATPTSASESPSEPPPPHSTPSTSRVPPISVPSPTWETPAGLPGLGDLGEPVEGPADGEAEGGTGSGEGSGETAGSGAGTGDGGLGAYRSELAAWLASHFHVEGSGLDAKALLGLRVRAVLELSEDRIVTDYSFQATGTAAIDDAARRALEAVKGQPVPAPPASLGSLQRRITVVLTCRPDTCD
jgi:hypothetical protein